MFKLKCCLFIHYFFFTRKKKEAAAPKQEGASPAKKDEKPSKGAIGKKLPAVPESILKRRKARDSTRSSLLRKAIKVHLCLLDGI